jgi:hypothetical protein
MLHVVLVRSQETVLLAGMSSRKLKRIHRDNQSDAIVPQAKKSLT